MNPDSHTPVIVMNVCEVMYAHEQEQDSTCWWSDSFSFGDNDEWVRHNRAVSQKPL